MMGVDPAVNEDPPGTPQTPPEAVQTPVVRATVCCHQLPQAQPLSPGGCPEGLVTGAGVPTGPNPPLPPPQGCRFELSPSLHQPRALSAACQLHTGHMKCQAQPGGGHKRGWALGLLRARPQAILGQGVVAVWDPQPRQPPAPWHMAHRLLEWRSHQAAGLLPGTHLLRGAQYVTEEEGFRAGWLRQEGGDGLLAPGCWDGRVPVLCALSPVPCPSTGGEPSSKAQGSEPVLGVQEEQTLANPATGTTGGRISWWDVKLQERRITFHLCVPVP
ncbi:hypothetical protein P7K49_040203 [Saguinus oedipus]|uniref:Uncharacterized protein n=1 Tax=Saguinus oedipus TaxID=9490 RepID=A0ABQ9T8M1_SAGOE|nr:hypothetical protein P7K49_040203 [Saguinus oedipus]